MQQRLAGVAFEDPPFLAQLDAQFAELFFAAVAHPPPAWAPLFEARSRKGIAPLQFALAGLNAHINRDLPLALVATCEQAGIELAEGSAQHHDYVRVNDVLAAVEREVKAQYLSGWLRRLDRLVHRWNRLDDVVAMWDVARARDAAWVNGQALYALHGDPLADRFVAALDRSVGLAGRGLLVPADSVLQRLARLL